MSYKDAMKPFDHQALHRRRQSYKLAGLVCGLLGLFVILEMIFKEPVPLRGVRFVFLGLSLLIGGGLCLYYGYRLPLAEAIEIIHTRGKGITASELVHEMRVDLATAQRIIDALLQKGFLRSTSNRSHAEEVFEPVQ